MAYELLRGSVTCGMLEKVRHDHGLMHVGSSLVFFHRIVSSPIAKLIEQVFEAKVHVILDLLLSPSFV